MMVTYIDAASAPLKNTGVIRLYTPEDFDGMRKACQTDSALPRRTGGNRQAGCDD